MVQNNRRSSASHGRSVYALIVAMLLPVSSVAEPADYVLDPEHISVGFLVSHLGFARVLGFFRETDGRFRFDEQSGDLQDVEIHVNTASVFTNHEDRDDHLRSGDFLDTRSHAAMTFTADSARRIGEREYEIDGQLELLGRLRPLTLKATWNKSGDYPIGRNSYAIGVSATGRLKRSDFGMDYGVDNGWVGDEVEILIEFEAKRQ